jgi:putative membrane protein
MMPTNATDQLVFCVGFVVLAIAIVLHRLVEQRRPAVARWVRGVHIIMAMLLLMLHGAITLGISNTALFIIVSVIIGSAVEVIGMRRSWVFGKYHYTEKIGPRLMFGLPLAIPLMWSSLSYMGWWSAKMLWQLTAIEPSSLVISISAASLITLLDLVTDPIATDEGLWEWPKGGRYYGVPLSNIRGWFLTAMLIMLSFELLKQPVTSTSNVPLWLLYMPGLGFAILSAVSARVCFERRLIVPGILGIVLTCIILLFWILLI